jgi:hypothetical protein
MPAQIFGDPDYRGEIVQTFVVTVRSRYGIDGGIIGERMTKNNSLTVEVEEVF